MDRNSADGSVVRLTRAELRAGATFEVVFEWTGMIEYEETVLWSLFVTDGQGRVRQFGHKRVGNEQFQFVFDHNAARQTNTAVSASLGLREGRLQLRFPPSSSANLDVGDVTEARAVLNFDGRDVSSAQAKVAAV